MKALAYLYFGFLVVWSGLAMASVDAKEDVLEIANNHKVFYRYHKAKRGEPTIVLMNGLIYPISNWDEFFQEMAKRGFGVLQLAYSTQPESLIHLDGETPFFADTSLTIQGPRQAGIETQTLVDETMAVIDHLKIERFNVMSLSYGSIPGSLLAAQEADRIDNMIFAAPAVMASHRYNAYGASRHAVYSVLPDYYDYYYDAELYNTMLPLIAAQPRPEGIQFMDFFHGVYQMARSSKWFDLKKSAEESLPKTHLFLASREDPPLFQDQIRFWELMDSNAAKGKMILFEGAPHALPGVIPGQVAEQTEKLIRGKLKEKESVIDVGGSGEGGKSSSGPTDEIQTLFLKAPADEKASCMAALRETSK